MRGVISIIFVYILYSLSVNRIAYDLSLITSMVIKKNLRKAEPLEDPLFRLSNSHFIFTVNTLTLSLLFCCYLLYNSQLLSGHLYVTYQMFAVQVLIAQSQQRFHRLELSPAIRSFAVGGGDPMPLNWRKRADPAVVIKLRVASVMVAVRPQPVLYLKSIVCAGAKTIKTG